MKKTMRNLLLILTVVTLMMSPIVTAFAAGTVTYDGDAKKFIFEPGSEYSPTDLFSDFKGVMPGDSIIQKVEIKNDVSNNVKIRLYIRSLGAKEGSEDFLSKLNLRVSQNGDSNLFDAPADQSAQLTEWVYLGTFYSGAGIDLDVTLDVPTELGNQYQEAVGYLEWQFKVEELPVEPDDPKPPQTGDTTNSTPYIVLASVSGLVLIFFLALGQRRKQEKSSNN